MRSDLKAPPHGLHSGGSFGCSGLSSRSSNANAYRGQTGNWGQGKWTGRRGEGWDVASQWLVHFWNFRLQSPFSSTPSLIVYFLALEVDCTFFKDSVQASAGGPDRTRLRTGCGPQGASLQPSHLFSQTAPFTASCAAPPISASRTLLKLFPLPGMPSAIFGGPSPTHPSQFS